MDCKVNPKEDLLLTKDIVSRMDKDMGMGSVIDLIHCLLQVGNIPAKRTVLSMSFDGNWES